MLPTSTMAERLLAHARICREIAKATSNEQTASELERLAEDCVQAARAAGAEPQRQRFHGAAGNGRRN